MHPIELALLNAISKHPNMPVVVAYSGGVDSQVLLHAIASLKKASPLTQPITNLVTVCHVNHGLSDNAFSWQVFAEQACLALNLPLKICRVNVQAQAQKSLESLARDARYQALHSIYQTPSLIITGHHSDDQAETFLLALKRGSGLKGLSAMGNETRQEKDLLLRPLLSISRADIIDYAKINALTWVEDESNTDTRFDRNFIRNNIMPLLMKRWPSITSTINRSSEHCREGQLLLDELAEEDLNLCISGVNSLTVRSLTQLSQQRFNNVIRYFLTKNNCLMPSTEQLAQLYLQLNADSDKNPVVKVGDNVIRRHKGTLYLTADFIDISNWHTDIVFNEPKTEIELPDNLGKLHFLKKTSQDITVASQRIIMPNAGQKVTIRFNHSNPICLPDYRNHSRSLKKILQELNIPVWQRKRIPFLYYDDVLVAAIGHFVCQSYIPKNNDDSILLNWS
ncbi:tRNA lysidine(34) synthetase TilS [Colwellia sp. 1_MG-2023]|jgi:tRNA(Ile)-lysidine synthase|uniref:tRNA lysidine(34) synthetase TilS n=1 Tax=unclassified Colwellia TaxID=196834 RepID=UPI001C08B8F1|nr:MULTISPECIES: tRNA lysidine(34) synthetase TilS [unclassified Colwellia]MBU2925696.1 tRNA lysidine(34) synthetase TilS [Colwellia sp. C2M11]MDO6651078.1 tRNA lysidine(34) synthetase TilS [Colwellia sp. 3_MG-2023]MDO6664113.1 tRNA lysidine(34) synthetase TilS [Colwellia sp. 2_MG-2023]MDO6688464.1 tRNA lysidine(34) synthetase TilS [Colwellia sp. 1_MG-2023]